MSEIKGIELIEEQVKQATGFGPSNVSIANWKILSSGNDDHYAIIRPGPTERPPLSFSVVDNNYRTIIEVWQRYRDDGGTVTDLLEYVDNITAQIDRYRKLADTTNTIRDANVIEYGEVMQKWNKDGGLSWLERDITVLWTEEESITYAE